MSCSEGAPIRFPPGGLPAQFDAAAFNVEAANRRITADWITCGRT
jgi:hypothetical protein